MWVFKWELRFYSHSFHFPFRNISSQRFLHSRQNGKGKDSPQHRRYRTRRLWQVHYYWPLDLQMRWDWQANHRKIRERGCRGKCCFCSRVVQFAVFQVGHSEGWWCSFWGRVNWWSHLYYDYIAESFIDCSFHVRWARDPLNMLGSWTSSKQSVNVVLPLTLPCGSLKQRSTT